jgi:hypothetical protein
VILFAEFGVICVEVVRQVLIICIEIKVTFRTGQEQILEKTIALKYARFKGQFATVQNMAYERKFRSIVAT